MIRRLAVNSAKSLKDAHPNHPVSIAVMAYSLEMIYGAFFTITLAVILGAAIGHVTDVIKALIAFALLRALTGGLHLKTGVACTLATSFGALIVVLLPISGVVATVINCVALVLVAVYGPRRSWVKRSDTVKSRLRYKLIAIVLVASNFIITDHTIAVVFGLQALSLIPSSDVREVD